MAGVFSFVRMSRTSVQIAEKLKFAAESGMMIQTFIEN